MKVLDASIILSWLLRDPVPEAAERLLDDHVSGRAPAVAPDLLRYEVANALARGSGLAPELAREGYERFIALEIETFALVNAEHRRALDLALEHGVTGHEASYVALALALDVPCVTADRRIARRLARLRVVEPVDLST